VTGPLQRKKLRIRTMSEAHPASYTTRDKVSVSGMRWPEHSADKLSFSVVLKLLGSVPTQSHNVVTASFSFKYRAIFAFDSFNGQCEKKGQQFLVSAYGRYNLNECGRRIIM
jgi:hypothetical protein